MVAAPFPPDLPAQAFRCAKGLVAGNGARAFGLPELGILAGRYDGIGPAIGDGVVTLARIVGPVCGDVADLLIGRDLAEQLRQHGRIADIAASELDRPDFQCFLIDPEVNLAPDAAFGAAMLAGIPLTFTLNLDPGAVDQEVQRPLRSSIRDVYGEGLLAA